MIEFNQLSDFFSDFYHFTPEDEVIYLDFHLHTTASDGSSNPEFFLDFLSEKKHLISITDHNEIRGSVMVAEAGINNVPAIELGCEDGFEILVFFKQFSALEDFYTREVEQHKHPYRMARTTKDIDYYLDLLAERECHISIPHISGLAQKNYIKNKPYIEKVLSRVDALETYNHGQPKKRNQTAMNVRKQHGLSATFGSDAHINREVLSFYRLLNREEKRHHQLMDKLYKLPMISGLAHKHLAHMLKKK